jgi:membrane-anchored protein YejM (alkaline phosphatase superfamily)
MILVETPRRKLVTQLVNWGHWFALLNIIIAIIIASIYILNSPAPGTPLGTLYLFTNWFSHIGFLTFFGFVIFILPMCYWVANARVVKISASVMAALALALLAFDALLYNKYGVHLSFSSANLIRDEAQTALAEFGWQQWGFFLLLFVVWLSFQLIVANALWQRIERLQKRKLGLPITTFFVACFVASHAMHVWADANLYQPIVRQDDMFPLSYPAKAKTLLAKYNLLDIEDYQQRKELQFNQNITGIAYPSEAIYCPVDRVNKVAILIVTDGDLPSSVRGLMRVENNYGVNSSTDNAINSVIFGLPELYHDALKGYAPILFDLPQSQGLKVDVFQVRDSKQATSWSSFKRDWAEFKQGLSTHNSDLSVGFVSAEQLQELLQLDIVNQYKIMLSTFANNANFSQSLMTNFSVNHNISNREDLAPTALKLLGCNAPARAYSTGTSLTLANSSDYVVSTKGNKVMLFTPTTRIEVLSNGNVRAFDLQSGDEVFNQVDTNLLSQAIKRLSRFSTKRKN